MPRRYPPEVRRQVIELARSGTKVAALVDLFGVSEVVMSTDSNLTSKTEEQFDKQD